MHFIRYAVENPVKVASGVILLVLFGLLSFFVIPVQLTPDVDQPVITITTRWPGASPQEIENEIIEPQEEKLKSVTGLRKMTSFSRRGEGVVELEFNVGVDKDNAHRDTIEKINQVSNYPDEVDRPQVVAADAALESPIAWLIFRTNTPVDVSTLYDFVDREVKPILERTDGVASVDIFGGREREVHVLVDPAKMAARGITFRQLEQALRGQNRNISAGTTSLGKREYTYRTVGEYRTVEDVANTVVDYQAGGPVRVGDLGEVVATHQKQYAFVKGLGQYVLAMPVIRETGANVISTMRGLKENLEKVNQEILAGRGLDMHIDQVYDETVYIDSAIDLVIRNIYSGGVLAILVLLIYLRSVRPTFVIAISIPISVIGTFLMVTLLGRNLNVVMLAGMAFAVGMVVDNSIVVLENIYRHRQMGRNRLEATLKGATEVWGAILASTLTTVAVFIPVIFIKEEAGELFRDIAIAIATAVTLSLVVALTVVPAVSARVIGRAEAMPPSEHVSRFAGAVGGFVAWVNRSTLRRVAVVGGLGAASIIGSWLLMPPAAYLPAGNRNLVFGFIDVPPGYSLEEFRRIGEVIESEIRPYWETDDPDDPRLVPVVMKRGGSLPDVEVKPPPIENFFFVAFNGGAIMGCISRVEGVVSPLVQVFNRATGRLAGALAFFQQVSLFGRSLSGGNTVEVELRSDNPEALDRAAGALFPQLMEKYGYPRPEPTNFNVGRPELQAIVDRVKAADVGLNVADVGFAVEAAINGAYVGGFREGGEEIDMRIRVNGTDNASERDIAMIPIRTPTGKTIPLGSVVEFRRVFEQQEIRHSESMRSIKFNVVPPPAVPLEAAIADIQENYIGALRAAGIITPDVIVSMEGNADKLVQTRHALLGNYTGLFNKPRLAGLSPVWSLAILGAVGVLVGVIIGLLASARWGLIIGGIGIALPFILALALNPALALELIQSRGLLAMLVTYLLMAALFESFIYPLVIMLSVPLAVVGGFLGLWTVHFTSVLNPVTPVQNFDVLTMLGFIILIGIVVNNAILIVHQAINFIRDEGLEPNAAIAESVRTRVRPIFMTAWTSVGGMLPLALMTGSGSELYRGLAGVMCGGLIVSTLFTLVVVPAMFSLLIDIRLALRHGLHVSEKVVSSHEEFEEPAAAAGAPGEPALPAPATK
jgi:HAE1 family hydrophobic/amphiphilic exporter-1